MRGNIPWFLLVVSVALIESTWLGAVRLQGVLPDLVLLLVIYFAVIDSQERAMFTGLVGGVFQDVAGDTGLGHHVLCLVVVGYLTGRVVERLITDHPAVKGGLVFVASILHGIIFLAIEYVQNPAMNATFTMMASTIPRAFYTALVTPILFFAFDRIRFMSRPAGRGA